MDWKFSYRPFHDYYEALPDSDAFQAAGFFFGDRPRRLRGGASPAPSTVPAPPMPARSSGSNSGLISSASPAPRPPGKPSSPASLLPRSRISLVERSTSARSVSSARRRSSVASSDNPTSPVAPVSAGFLPMPVSRR